MISAPVLLSTNERSILNLMTRGAGVGSGVGRCVAVGVAIADVFGSGELARTTLLAGAQAVRPALHAKISASTSASTQAMVCVMS